MNKERMKWAIITLTACCLLQETAARSYELGMCRSCLYTNTTENANFILKSMSYEGVGLVRLTMTHSNQKEKIKDYILECNRLNMDVCLVISFSGCSEFFETNAERRIGYTLTPYPYSMLDLDRAHAWFTNVFEYFFTNNCPIWGFEIGNEVNWFGYNGDLPIVTGGRYYVDPEYTPDDLNLLSEVSKLDYNGLGEIAEGARRFGKVCYRAWLERNRRWGQFSSETNPTAPQIIMGGLNRPIDGPYGRNGSLMMPEAWLKIMKGTFTNQSTTETNSLLGVFDAYGLHFYPGLTYKASETSFTNNNYETKETFKVAARNYINHFMGPVIDVTGVNKFFHVTEFGFNGWPYREVYVPETGFFRGGAECYRLAAHQFFMEVVDEPAFSSIKFDHFFFYGWDDDYWSYYGGTKEAIGILLFNSTTNSP